MKLIVCIDERGGLMFNKRRQSRDRILQERVLELAKGARLFLSPYSAKLFGEGEGICVSENPASEAGKDDFYFLEDKGYTLSDCQEIYLYNWNRHYPSDITFSHDLKKEGYRRISKADFAGSSHEKITEEHYVSEE